MNQQSLMAAHADDLARLAVAGRLRVLAPRRDRDFASNDYLGLCASPVMRQAAEAALARGVPVGSGGSRLLRGNSEEHEALEAEAAAFFGGEAALFFPTGFTANSALLSCMPQAGDRIFADALVHASMHEGMRLSRAHRTLFAHGDVHALDTAMVAWRRRGGCGQAWIAVESLYSMDGDFAPLADLLAVARRHQAMLIVDEAHATGVFGPDGRGLVAGLGRREPNIITLHTFGKALGCEGAVLVGPALMRDYLVNRARSFIYSTAPSPLVAAIAREALRIGAASNALREELRALIAVAHVALAPLGITCNASPIMPLLLGDDKRTMHLAETMRDNGFDIRGVRPPTVPEGTSRLRLVITRNVSTQDITRLRDMLAPALAEILP